MQQSYALPCTTNYNDIRILVKFAHKHPAKRNKSDPVCRPRAFDILANDILRNVRVSSKAKVNNKINFMHTYSHLFILHWTKKSCCLFALCRLCFMRMAQRTLHHVHDNSISCLNVTHLFQVCPQSVSDLWREPS